MKLTHKILVVLILFIAPCTGAIAQQEAMYSQFAFNKQQINPGYTGYREVANATLLHRSQWVGFKGAPSTQMLIFDTPLKVDEMAIGGSVYHDKIGPSDQLSLNLDVAYRLRLGNRSTLSFGAKATGTLFQSNLTDLYLTTDYWQEEDEFFMHNPKNVYLANVGFGMYYYKKDHYIGLSSPGMLRNNLEKKGSALHEVLDGRTEPTIYLMAGKEWKLNRAYKVQPNLMVKGTMNAPISIGVLTQLVYMDQLVVGLFYNFKEVGGAVLQWQFNKQWKVGYSVDVATSKLIQTNYGSHELMINYQLTSQRKRIVYPRYF